MSTPDNSSIEAILSWLPFIFFVSLFIVFAKKNSQKQSKAMDTQQKIYDELQKGNKLLSEISHKLDMK
jgi:preprotein translocase subunit YajC